MSVLRILGALGPVLAAAILRTDRRIIRRLRSAQATEATRALPIAGSGPLAGWRLRRLVGAGALAMPAEGRYFLVETGWRAWRIRRRRRALAILAILLSVLLLILWMSAV